MDEGKIFYNLLFLETIVDENETTIIKLLVLDDVDFYGDNYVLRFSLEELIEGRAYQIEREEKRKQETTKLFSNVKNNGTFFNSRSSFRRNNYCFKRIK